MEAPEPHALVKLCPSCGAESPANFASCWRCQADLSSVAPTAGQPEREPRPRTDAAPERPLTSGERRALVLEGIVVHLVIWGWALPWRIFERIGSRELPRQDTVAANLWTVSTILFDVAAALLVLYVMWRAPASPKAAGVSKLRWWHEVGWGAALVMAAAILVPVAQAVADAVQLPRWTTDTPPQEPRTALSALFFLTAALKEEVVFRAYLITRFEQVFGRSVWAVIGSALLFTLYHVPSPAFALELVVVGLVLGGAFRVGRRLPRLVLAHWAWNVVIAR